MPNRRWITTSGRTSGSRSHRKSAYSGRLEQFKRLALVLYAHYAALYNVQVVELHKLNLREPVNLVRVFQHHLFGFAWQAEDGMHANIQLAVLYQFQGFNQIIMRTAAINLR
jgi:hypothetical protein